MTSSNALMRFISANFSFNLQKKKKVSKTFLISIWRTYYARGMGLVPILLWIPDLISRGLQTIATAWVDSMPNATSTTTTIHFSVISCTWLWLTSLLAAYISIVIAVKLRSAATRIGHWSTFRMWFHSYYHINSASVTFRNKPKLKKVFIQTHRR